MKYMGLIPIILVIAFILISEKFPGGRIPDKQQQAFAELPVEMDQQAEIPASRDLSQEVIEGTRRIACDYRVWSLQQVRHTVKLANFEPFTIPDNFTAPPDTLTVYGKSANNNIWEGSFALQLEPHRPDAIVIQALHWERLPPCYITIVPPR